MIQLTNPIPSRSKKVPPPLDQPYEVLIKNRSFGLEQDQNPMLGRPPRETMTVRQREIKAISCNVA